MAKRLDLLIDIRFWRSKNGAEVDFVVLRGERMVAIEVKAAEFFRPTISRGTHSFLEACRPACLGNASLRQDKVEDGVPVRFVRPWELNLIHRPGLSEPLFGRFEKRPHFGALRRFEKVRLFCGGLPSFAADSRFPRRMSLLRGASPNSTAQSAYPRPLLRSWARFSQEGTDIPVLGRIFPSWDRYSYPGTDIPILGPLFPSWDGCSHPGTNVPILGRMFPSWDGK